jgi:NAD(P) transhydrogenase subunit beta
MSEAMNRSIANVLFGGFGADAAATGAAVDASQLTVRSTTVDDAAVMLAYSRKVVIVPGYGLAVAEAQHAVRSLANELEKRGVDVKYAIHPVAGRMPGHMNVLLAEARVPYDIVLEMEEINHDFPETDVVIIIGANDIVNPAAQDDPSSPIYGMPVLNVEYAGTVLFIKLGMAEGYAGVQNELLILENTMMLFADAKKMTEEIVKALDH